MKHLLLSLFSLLLAVPGLAPAQTTPPRSPATQQPTPKPAVAPRVYVCGGGSERCAGLNRCSHGVSAVTVAAAEQMGRRPCKKCY
jgi:hypothetical protein